jgi:hypothetical protein
MRTNRRSHQRSVNRSFMVRCNSPLAESIPISVGPDGGVAAWTKGKAGCGAGLPDPAAWRGLRRTKRAANGADPPLRNLRILDVDRCGGE